MKTIGAVLFPDFEMLDLYGPLEMFSYFPDAFKIRTVAKEAGAVRASGGPETVAEDGIDDAVHYDLLVVPGGRGTRTVGGDAAFLAWLKARSDAADITTSVCTGSLLLAKSGVLAGKRATTNKLALASVVDQTSGVDWQRAARWVKDGTIYTSSGVSAGIDMALAVIGDILGSKAAQDAAGWAEYIRNPDPSNDPFAVAGGI